MTAVSEDVILLDDTLTETFLTDLQSRGRTEETLKCYRNSLGKLCGFLPGRVVIQTEVHTVDVLTAELLQHWLDTCAAASDVAVSLPARGVQ